MTKPQITILYNNTRDADRAMSLAADYARLGYKTVVTSDFSLSRMIVEIAGAQITYEVARENVERELSKLKIDLVVLENGEGLPLPAYETTGAAGMDLRAAIDDESAILLNPGDRFLVPCGFSIALPEGYEAQVRPRSGLAWKHGITVLNSPGTIDCDYRGQVMAMLINHSPDPFIIKRGDRIAQMVIAAVTQARFVPVASLPSTTRGAGGFGSTGV